MSTNPAPTDFPEPSSAAHQPWTAHRAEMPGDLSDIANALGLQPRMIGGRQALTDLVYRLEKVEYFQVFFLTRLANYDWASHDRDPEIVVNNVMVLQNSPDSCRRSEESKWFSECLVRWRHYISIEMDMLVRVHGEDFLWFPQSRTQKDAFGYVLFLYMYLRSGKAPAIVSQLYADALRFVGNCLSDPEEWLREV
ncbi:hypothetical protein F4782DRAFT_529817 [Xylaria castorea]|nr:hypothetical protein F4782DRAFT_529817 [Xylaria castorea]